MEYLDNLYELCDTLKRDVEKMNERIKKAGGELNDTSLSYIDKLSHALKSVTTTIKMLEEERGGDYSHMGNSYARGDRMGRVHWNDGSVSYGGDMSYDGDMHGDSYARGRGSNAKRDAMGRYSSDNYGGYSRADAKSMAHELKELMQDADPQMRPEFQTLINKLERM